MIILIGGEKGGTGKTTIATNLITERVQQEHDAILIDADPQASSTCWSECRGGNSLSRVPVIQKSGDNISADIKDFSNRYQDVIIDTGGRDSKELRSAMLVADKIIVPIQTSAFDVWTLSAVDKLLRTAKAFNPSVQTFILLSKVSTNQFIQDEAETRELLKEFPDLKLMNSVIHDRIAFRKAAKQGKAVSELEPMDEKATSEVKQLYTEIFG